MEQTSTTGEVNDTEGAKSATEEEYLLKFARTTESVREIGGTGIYLSALLHEASEAMHDNVYEEWREATTDARKEIGAKQIGEASSLLGKTWDFLGLEQLNNSDAPCMAIIAGGYVEACITKAITNRPIDPLRDIDVFLTYKHQECHDVIDGLIEYVAGFGKRIGKICISNYALTFVVDRTTSVQIIPKMGMTPGKVIRRFDLDCVAAYYDGKKLHYESRAMEAWRNRMNIYRPEHTSCTYASRIRKYARRGYDFYISTDRLGNPEEKLWSSSGMTQNYKLVLPEDGTLNTSFMATFLGSSYLARRAQMGFNPWEYAPLCYEDDEYSSAEHAGEEYTIEAVLSGREIDYRVMRFRAQSDDAANSIRLFLRGQYSRVVVADYLYKHFFSQARREDITRSLMLSVLNFTSNDPLVAEVLDAHFNSKHKSAEESGSSMVGDHDGISSIAMAFAITMRDLITEKVCKHIERHSPGLDTIIRNNPMRAVPFCGNWPCLEYCPEGSDQLMAYIKPYEPNKSE